MLRELGSVAFAVFCLIGISAAVQPQDAAGQKRQDKEARKKNAAPVAADDAYSVPENGILRVTRQALTPVAVSAEVNKPAAQKVLDGDLWTYWQAAGENPAITFDLGRVRRVVGIRESTGGFPGNPFTLSAYTNGTDYTPVAQGTLTETGFGETLFAPRGIRYLQLRIARTGSGGFGELAEFQTLISEGVLANDTDADGDALKAALDQKPKHGKLGLNADGSFTYQPDQGFHGTDRFRYKASDDTADSEAATVTITVVPLNRAPLAADDAGTTDGKAATVIRVLANDRDPDGDRLTVSAVTQGAVGKVTISPDGTVIYTPSGNFQDQDRFTYTVSDGRGGTATAKVVITRKAEKQ